MLNEMLKTNENKEKFGVFLEIARGLNRCGTVPLLYGSLGLWRRVGGEIFADDIDVLLPGIWLGEKWGAFRAFMEKDGWALIDTHEHTFEKGGVHCSFAVLEELEPFAGVKPEKMEVREESGARYGLLSVKQYLAVYRASAKDGYRVNTRGKKDGEKIVMLEKMVRA